MRRAVRRRAQRGQALVEFALVLPVFLLLLFGLIEMSLIYAAQALYNSAVLQAVRFESLAGTRVANIDTLTCQGIEHVVQNLFVAHVVRIEIYQSNGQGRGPQTGSENAFDASCAVQAPQAWPIANRSSAVSAPIFVGVRVTFAYTWLTSFVGALGTTLTLHATAIAPEILLGG